MRLVNLVCYSDFKNSTNTELDQKARADIEDNESLDPIAFYGYLLGRAINCPNNETLITRFSITMPVKFDDTVRESIKSSLEYGLKLALPSKIRDKAKVVLGQAEPVAFVRSIIGHPKVTEKGWMVGSSFAVFDFGGGTLDFAFGVYRDAQNMEREDYNKIIEIKRTAGDEKGGAEYLIHWLAYEVYKANGDAMKKDKIPFPKPMGEDDIELFPKELLRTQTKSAQVNLIKISEMVTRNLFVGNKENQKDGYSHDVNEFDVVVMSLENTDGEPTVSDLQVNNRDLMENLYNKLEQLVKNFESEMKEAFGVESIDSLQDIHIFRAGNASRSKMIEEIMNRSFPGIAEKGRIHLIDEESVHGVKPKTAVAIGQLKLDFSDGEIGVVQSNSNDGRETPFEFNVGIEDIDCGSMFKVIIKSNSTDNKWHNLGRFNKSTNRKVIYYTPDINVEYVNNSNILAYEINISTEDVTFGNWVWVRAIHSNKIEFAIGMCDEEPSPQFQPKEVLLPRR